MMTIGTLSKAMRTILLATVLTPAPLMAEPALTARQMLGQAQDQAMKSGVRKITDGGPILADMPAMSPSVVSKIQQPVVMAPATSSEPPNPPTLSDARDDTRPAAKVSAADPQTSASAPAVQVASIAPAEMPGVQARPASIVILAAPATMTETTQAPSAPVAPEAASAASPVIPEPEAAATAAASVETSTGVLATTTAAPPMTEIPTEQTTPIVAKNDNKIDIHNIVVSKTDAVAKPAAKKTSASSRVAHPSPATRQRPARANNAAIEIRDANLGPQLQRILHRPEVRSLLAKYGMN